MIDSAKMLFYQQFGDKLLYSFMITTIGSFVIPKTYFAVQLIDTLQIYAFNPYNKFFENLGKEWVYLEYFRKVDTFLIKMILMNLFGTIKLFVN